MVSRRPFLLSASGAPRSWRTRSLEERVFNAEDHFRRMSAEGRVSNMEAEAHYRRMKNAGTELVGRSEYFFS